MRGLFPFLACLDFSAGFFFERPQMSMKTTFDDAPNDAMVRPRPLCELLGFSKSTLWRKAGDEGGEFPKPVKLSAGVTAFRVGDVRAWLKSRAQA